MELMFNELSSFPISTTKYEAIEKMAQFAQTYKKSRDFGFKRIRSDKSVSEINLTDSYTIYNWLIDNAVSHELKSFMFGSIITPFINDGDDEVANAYVEADYYYRDNEGNEVNCLGLVAAHLYELPCISLSSSEEWKKNHFTIIVRRDGASEQHQVPNVFSVACFSIDSIAKFVENLGEIELIRSSLNPDEKDIHLADHHGKKELKHLCERLKHSEYVTAMRSTNWGGNTFIRRIHNNGVVELTLVESERKYALWVQTTGRNYRETEAIAKKLREKYS